MESPTDKYSHVKRCINCGLALPGYSSKYNVTSLQPKCQEILKHWMGCEDLSNHQLCIKCGTIMDEYSESNDTSIPERMLGYPHVCIGCGMSLLKKHHLNIKQELVPIATKQWPWYNILKIKRLSCRKCIQRLQRIFNREKILNLNNDLETTSEFETSINESGTKYEIEIATNELGCGNKKTKNMVNYASRYTLVPCTDPTTSKKTYKIESNKLQASNTEMLKFHSVLPKTSKHLDEIVKKLDKSYFPRLDPESNRIILSNGKRTSSTKLCTISRGCGKGSKRRFPKSKRRLLATCYDIFVPAHSRVCGIHISFDEYDPKTTKYHRNFTVPQFEMFMDEIKPGMIVMDFENVEAMADHICEYWTGLKVTQFVQMYEGMNQPKLMKSALAAYLISNITGDSVQKLAKLFNIDSVTLKKQLKSVETHFSENQ